MQENLNPNLINEDKKLDLKAIRKDYNLKKNFNQYLGNLQTRAQEENNDKKTLAKFTPGLPSRNDAI